MLQIKLCFSSQVGTYLPVKDNCLLEVKDLVWQFVEREGEKQDQGCKILKVQSVWLKRDE